jgi:hypothetical protein
VSRSSRRVGRSLVSAAGRLVPGRLMRPRPADPIRASGLRRPHQRGRTHDRKRPPPRVTEDFPCRTGAIHTWR